jgi:uncharacterized protein YjgD (DUF1641 family)
VIEPPVVDEVERETRALEGAALASLTPRMVARVGSMTEELVELLDMLTSPEVVRLAERMRRLAPTLVALIDSALCPPEGDCEPLTVRLTEAGHAAQKAMQEARPLAYGELLQLPRKPAVARVVRAMVAFLETMTEPAGAKGTVTRRDADRGGDIHG